MNFPFWLEKVPTMKVLFGVGKPLVKSAGETSSLAMSTSLAVDITHQQAHVSWGRADTVDRDA